jgi:hypothetical protein
MPDAEWIVERKLKAVPDDEEKNEAVEPRILLHHPLHISLVSQAPRMDIS